MEKEVYLIKEIEKKFGFKNYFSVRDYIRHRDIKTEKISGVVLKIFMKNHPEKFQQREHHPSSLILVDKKDFERAYYNDPPRKKSISNIKESEVDEYLTTCNNAHSVSLNNILLRLKDLEKKVNCLISDKKETRNTSPVKSNNLINTLTKIEKQKKKYILDAHEEYIIEKDEIEKLVKAMNITGTKAGMYYDHLSYVTGIDIRQKRNEAIRTSTLKSAGKNELKRLSVIKNFICEDKLLRKAYLKFLRQKEKEIIEKNIS